MPSFPYELISAPVTLYTAPERTPAPEISAAPPLPWGVFGTNGDRSYSEDGLVVSLEQTVEEQMVLGSTIAQKAFRTEENFTISITLFDMSAELFGLVMSTTPSRRRQPQAARAAPDRCP